MIELARKKITKICWLPSPFIFLTSFEMGGFLVEMASQVFDMKWTQGQICDG